MGKLGLVLVVVAGLALVGCSTKDLPAAERGGSSTTTPASTSVSASASLATPSAPLESPPASVAPSTPTVTPRPSAVPPVPPGPPLPPLPSATVTAGPITAPGPVTAQETAFLTQLKSLSAHVADGPAAIALGHKVCNQFGVQVSYNQIADSITGYDADDARNLITAAVLTLCPQYKSQVGG